MNAIEFIEKIAKIEIDFQDIVDDMEVGGSDYDFAFDVFIEMSKEYFRQFYAIAKELGYCGTIEDFDEDIIKIRLM